MDPLKTQEENRLKEILGQVRSQLSRIHHDVNNPLSVISGNTQLMFELSKALGVESDLQGPISDIEEAIERLTESVDRLMVVRTILSDVEDRLDAVRTDS